MSFMGMNVDEVRGLATQFNHSADEIHTLMGQLTGALEHTHWVGTDATNFRNEWTGTHVTQLSSVVQALRDAATKANNNATEQENTSTNG